jgi:FkbM family methyltransferase
MGIKRQLRKLLRKLGIEVSWATPVSDQLSCRQQFCERYGIDDPIARRKRLFDFYGIDTVLDVGANTGQFGQQLRNEVGFSNRIVSFEPLNSAFDMLKKNVGGDPQWEVFNFALGDTEAKAEINIAGNSFSSSLLKMMPRHLRAAPESQYVGRQVIEIRRLDSIFDDICSNKSNIYMKIDTQGFESKVIKGATNSLPFIDTIQMEMSLVPLYEDELVFADLYKLLCEKRYSLVSIESGFSDRESGQLLQVDGVFRRS